MKIGMFKNCSSNNNLEGKKKKSESRVAVITPIQYHTGHYSQAAGKKRNERHAYWYKVSLFIYDLVLYKGNHKHYTRKIW